MSSGAITIGRNIGVSPMPVEQWHKFGEDIESLITDNGGTIFLRASGIGSWDGVSEESAVFTFAGAANEVLKERLPFLALTYGQDAIALLDGETWLLDRAW